MGKGTAAGALLALLTPGWAQTTVHMRSQSREPDFSTFAVTKPARVVAVLPGTCASGEVVALASGSASAGLYLCTNAGTWSAVVAHAHSLTDVSGISGKQGSGSLLQSFGGGSAAEGTCVEFDANGSLRSSGQPCAASGVPNASSSFVAQTSVAVVHNRGTRDVVVECHDSSNEWFLPDRVVPFDTETVIVYFRQAQSGSCAVNAGSSGGSAIASVFGRTGAVVGMSGDYDFAKISGLASLPQGGTNQSGWTAGRCVQVSTDGTKLESAGAGCGTAGVVSVYGRTGSVTAQSGDYQFSQIGGVVGVTQGGTNQNAWTAGRCVQVSADGTRLESAGAGCGTSGVVSVYGRTGSVTAQSGDYQFSQVGGVAAVGQGGTGGSTAAEARVNLLPGYSGNGGKCLTLNSGGTDTEWTTCGGGEAGGGQVAGTGLLGTGTSLDPFRVNPSTVPTRISATASLTFSTFADTGNCEEQSMTLTGAAAGDVATIGLPNTLPEGIVVGAQYVSSTDTVTLRLCRLAGANTVTEQTFTAQIVRSF